MIPSDDERFIPVKDEDNLLRDKQSGAVVNGNTYEFDAFVERKRKERNFAARIEKLEDGLERIERLLQQALGVKNGSTEKQS